MRSTKRNSSSQLKRPWFAATAAGFRRPRRAFVGVDIGATAVKLVELSHRNAATSAFHLRTWGIEPLPQGIVEAASAGANISDPNAVGEAIRRLRTRVGAKARGAALAVPDAAAVTKTLRMDAGLTDEELEVEVALEAERHMPFPPDETALDFELSQLCLDDPALVEVDVVACHVEQVRRREAAAAAGGLKAEFVEVETAALARAGQWLDAGRSVAPADPGPSSPFEGKAESCEPPLDAAGPRLLTAWGLARRGWPAFVAADSSPPSTMEVGSK